MKSMGRLARCQLGLALALLSLLASGQVLAGQVEVQFFGHSAVRITSVEGKVIVIDPFFKKNPLAPAKYRDLTALGKVDLILVTHGHFDHALDLPELASLTGAPVVAIWELGLNLISMGILDADHVITPAVGGTVTPLGKGIKVHMVPAIHSSSLDLELLGIKEPETKAPKFIPGGDAVGFVIELENGFSIYHAGDTDIFGDMELIHDFFKPNLAMVPIGGFFTMDPERAAYALKQLIKPKQAIPIHYGTFPVINRTPEELKEAMGDSPIEILDLKPGEVVKY